MPDHQHTTNHCVEDPQRRQEMARLFKQLGSRNAVKRERAEQILRDMGMMAVEPLLGAVAKEVRWRRIWRTVILAMTVLCIADKVWLFFHRGFRLNDIQLFVWIFIIYQRFPEASLRYRTLVRLLTALEDRRAVGHFAEAIDLTSYKDWEARKVARASLIRLLPQLRASDAHLLNDRQRGHLHRELEGTDKELILAILKGLEQIGDARDLPVVEKISSSDPEVREAAKACVPYLLTRAEQQKTSQTLLRASDAIATAPDVLLRPATGGEYIEAQALLRAGSDGVKEIR